MRTRWRSALRFAAGMALMAAVPWPAAAATRETGGVTSPAPWLADRGTGIWTSIFGTYVNSRELLVMPFVEGYYDQNFEYKPAELGYGLDQDFRGRFRATEGEMFLAYGLNDRFAVELEASIITARLDKSAADPSAQPPRLQQSGQGDWQMELDWRVVKETATHPELFALLEVDPPSHRNAALIGTADWEAKLDAGLIRGLRWGTFGVRGGVTYSAEGGSVESGEYAIEYLKRLSRTWGVYAGMEAEQDEVELIGELQYHFSPHALLRLNLARGLSSKAIDWGPDVGVMFSFPPK